jgi:hypothetical protein
MFRQHEGTDELVVDEAAHELPIRAVDRITWRRSSCRRDEMIECADFVEQLRDFSLSRHVGGKGPGAAAGCSQSALCGLQLVGRTTDDHHLRAAFDGRGRHTEADARAASDNHDFLT